MTTPRLTLLLAINDPDQGVVLTRQQQPRQATNGNCSSTSQHFCSVVVEYVFAVISLSSTVQSLEPASLSCYISFTSSPLGPLMIACTFLIEQVAQRSLTAVLRNAAPRQNGSCPYPRGVGRKCFNQTIRDYQY